MKGLKDAWRSRAGLSLIFPIWRDKWSCAPFWDVTFVICPIRVLSRRSGLRIDQMSPLLTPDRGSVSTRIGAPLPVAIPNAIPNAILVPLGGPLDNIMQEGGRARRRRISPQAGHALEILGHAIEYLSDEFVHAGGALTAHNPQVEAVQLLMGINRQIYFDCPIVPSLGERWRALLRIGTA
jgi:hypothetical protein